MRAFRPSDRARRLVASWALAAFLAAGTGCLADRIRTAPAGDPSLAGAATVRVAVAPGSPSPELATRMLARLETNLAARGYSVVAGEAAADARVELSIRKQRVKRKTYSADTDANGERLVERTEAVVVLRATGEDRHELFRCEARGRLPEPPLAALEREEDLVGKLVERAVARIAQRR